MNLSKTGRMELMARMTGRLRRNPGRFPYVSPGFMKERDTPNRSFEALAEAAGLRERFPDAAIPDEVRGGFLIPPEFAAILWDTLEDVTVCNPPVILGPPPVGSSPYVELEPRNLSPREEALLREAPVFRLSPIEPQPDVVVISPKENQC